MAITIRNTKGLELSYFEMDTNFTELYNSSSIDGTSISLFSHGTGSFTAVTHSLTVDTGSTLNLYSESGSTGTVSGSLVVTGRLTAQEFNTEITSASIIFTSGSTIFGDTLDDTHNFTGSLLITGSTSTAGNSTYNGNSTITGSSIISGSLTVTGDSTITGSLNTSGSVTLTNSGSTTFTVENGYVILTEVSESLNFPSDASASAAGVPLGGLYRNGNAIYIRTT